MSRVPGASTSQGIDPRPTLIVTRPAQDARALIAALRARGRDVVALPVIAIEAAADPSTLATTMAHVEDYRLVVFVSPNAIRQALAQRVDEWPIAVPIGVMGPGSVETLKALGIAGPTHRVIDPRVSTRPDAAGDRFDSEALFAALDDALGLSRDFEGRVLILRGNGGRAWFAERLRSLGIAVDEVAAYRRVRPDADADAAERLRRLFAARDRPVFIVTSSEGIANLLAIVERALADDGSAPLADVRSWLLGCRLLAPHRRIAEKAHETGFSEVSVCAPGDAGILAAIE